MIGKQAELSSEDSGFAKIEMPAALRKSVKLATDQSTPEEVKYELGTIRRENHTDKRTEGLVHKVMGLRVNSDMLADLSTASSLECLLTNPMRLLSVASNVNWPENDKRLEEARFWVRAHADPAALSMIFRPIRSSTEQNDLDMQLSNTAEVFRGDIRVMRILGAKGDFIWDIMKRQHALHGSNTDPDKAVDEFELRQIMLFIKRIERRSRNLLDSNAPEDILQ